MAEHHKARVFISFVHEDSVVANALKFLVESELQLRDAVFQSSDQRQVYAGDVWLEKITAALRNAEVILLMLSKRSVRRPWVNFEAGAAWLSDGKIVIPCCYGKQRKGALPHPYSALQAVQLEDRFGPEYLLESIHHHLRLETPKPVTGLARAIRKHHNQLDTSGSVAEKVKGTLGYLASPDYPYDALESVLTDFEDED